MEASPLDRGFSLENGNPSATFFDDPNIQIIISLSSHIPNLSHEHTTSAQDENREVNGMTPEDLSSLKRELYLYALHSMWHEAQPIFDQFSEMIRIPLTASGDTALHVAVSANNIPFVNGLVKLMTPEDLKIQNSDGMLPVHLAALTGNHNIVQHLCSQNLLHKMDSKDIERLFFMTISGSMFDVATKLFEEYPTNLAIARDDQKQLTALHMLARKPPQKLYSRKNNKEGLSGEGLQLFLEIWSQVSQLEYKRILELITHPSTMLFDAVKSGNVEALKWLLYMNPELVTVKDPSNKGRNLLQFAVLCRQRSIFFFILKMGTVHLILQAVDNDRNSVLHLAAHHQDESSLISNIHMRKELLIWFKEVEKSVPPELRTMRNIDGKTPNDILYDKNKKLSKQATERAKGIAKSGMVVAALIVSVAFAAALAAPHDNTNRWFKIFFLANAVALFTSSTSIISFLSIFTSSSFTEGEFIISLPRSLLLGLNLLYMSIISMVIAFIAVSLLILDHKSKWLAVTVSIIGIVPVLTFIALQGSLFDVFVDLWLRIIYYCRSKFKGLGDIVLEIYIFMNRCMDYCFLNPTQRSVLNTRPD